MNRWRDWWEQALRDLSHAEHAVADADHEWAAFAAHQAAEKAVKALIMAHGGEPWGHSVMGLLESLPEDAGAQKAVVEAGSRLDKHYLPARYPNGFPSGYPGKFYTEGEAKAAIRDARQIADFCRGKLPE
jgi:HEPN domain-containing protein